MLVQYCVRPEVEIILFAVIAVKHLISQWMHFHSNISALGLKRVAGRKNKHQNYTSFSQNWNFSVNLWLFSNAENVFYF